MYSSVHLAVSWPTLCHLCSSRKASNQNRGFLYTTISKRLPSFTKYCVELYDPMAKHWFRHEACGYSELRCAVHIKYTSHLYNMVFKKSVK